MKDKDKTKTQLINELAAMRQRITELENSEAKLKQEKEIPWKIEEKYRALIEHASDAIIITDSKGNFLEVNKKTEELLGYTRKELAGMNPRNIHPKEELERIIYDFSRMAAGEIHSCYDTKVLRKDGRQVPVDVTASSVEYNGRILVQGIFRDITEQKQADEERREVQARYRLLFECVPYGIVIVDPATACFVEFNETVHKQLGYSREEFAGLSIPDIEVVESSKETLKHIKKIMRVGRDDFETMHRTKQGEIKNIHVTAQMTNISGYAVYHCVWRDMTEQKRAEKALQKSESKLNAMLQSIPDHMSMIDNELNIIWANVTATRMFGNDIIGRKCYEVYHRRKEPCEPYPCLTLKSFKDGEIHEHETEVVNEEGKTIYFHCTANVSLRDKDNKPIAVLEVSRDITEYKQAEEKLRENEEKYRQLVDSINKGICVAQDGMLKFVNPMFMEIFGRSKHDLTTLPFTEFIHPDDRNMVLESHIRRMKGEKFSTRYEFRIITSDGSIRWVEIDSVMIQWNGKPAALAFMGDITEHKQVEEALRESEERLRLLSDNLPSGMVYQLDFGEDGSSRTFTYVSAGVEQLHGITAAELKNDAAAIYNQVYENDRPLLAAREIEAMTAMSTFGTEHRVRRASGEIRWHLVASSPRRLTNNHLVWDGIEIDITDRKRAEEEQEKLILELQQALKKVRLLSGLLPVCASCKKIRNDKGYWEQIEVYIRDHSEAVFSHGICPECAQKLYPKYYKKK